MLNVYKKHLSNREKVLSICNKLGGKIVENQDGSISYYRFMGEWHPLYGSQDTEIPLGKSWLTASVHSLVFLAMDATYIGAGLRWVTEKTRQHKLDMLVPGIYLVEFNHEDKRGITGLSWLGSNPEDAAPRLRLEVEAYMLGNYQIYYDDNGYWLHDSEAVEHLEEVRAWYIQNDYPDLLDKVNDDPEGAMITFGWPNPITYLGQDITTAVLSATSLLAEMHDYDFAWAE